MSIAQQSLDGATAGSTRAGGDDRRHPASEDGGQDVTGHLAYPDLSRRKALRTPQPLASAILMSPPDVGDSEREALLRAFDSGWIAPMGDEVDAFEREIAERLGVRHGVALASGTAALHLALLAAGIGPGDRVIVPSLTFAATANAVMYVGAEPIFVDCARDTWTVDPELVAAVVQRCERKARPVRAVIAVDLYGQCADYESLSATCERYGVVLIEDAAEGLGATCGRGAAGSFGLAAALSFNGNKMITTSGGGMLMTDSDDVAAVVKHLATQAREPVPHYEHKTVGYNYRLSNLLAALGRAQLQTLDEKVKARRETARFYEAAFDAVPGLEPMPRASYGESACWLSCFLVDAPRFGCERDKLVWALLAAGIESRPTWKPMHLQPVFERCETVGGCVSEDVFQRGLCLPSGSALTDPQRARVVEAVLAASVGHGAQ
jgi:dTDP-4-amino-4,6-dideoxygalactose transaminase